MKKSAYLIALVLLGHLHMSGQMKGGVEQYFYLGDSGEVTIMPVLHMQQKGGWYTEARYNYEEAKTISLYSGKKFSHHNKLSWSVTPLIGFSVGQLTASSAALEVEVNKSKFFSSPSHNLRQRSTNSIRTFSLTGRNSDMIFPISFIRV